MTEYLDTKEFIKYVRGISPLQPAYEMLKRNCKFFRVSEIAKDFNADFLDKEKCTEWVLRHLHPEGAFCPACKNKIEDETTQKNFWSLKRCKCKNCGKWFSAYNNTFLHDSHLSPRQAVMIAVFLSQGISHKVIAVWTGLHPDTIKMWQKRFEMFEENK